MNTDIIQLVEVIRVMRQGYSKPFLCTAENGDEYIVKGEMSGRKSQISEWICGNLAKKLGLPIAEFSLVEIPIVLWEELPLSLKRIGPGIAFGSKKVEVANWLEESAVDIIPRELQQKIIAFDLWIKNMDRTRINPNLLYQAEEEGLVVIDHNNAFDNTFDHQDFLDTHIFNEAFSEIYSDIVNRNQFEKDFNDALAHLPDICNNLPSSWEWENHEEDLPTNYDFAFVNKTLKRLNMPNELWRIK